MMKLIRLATAVTVAAAGVALLAGPAAGHELNGASLTCSAVSGTFHDFAAQDHPIVWHVQVGSATPQIVATAESPSVFVGSGTATADISALTSQLNGATATVQAFATWPGGQSATQSAELTCGVPVQVSGEHSEAPAAAPAAAPVAVPVQAAATFTG